MRKKNETGILGGSDSVVLGDVPHVECVGNPEEKFSSYDLNARWQWLVVSY